MSSNDANGAANGEKKNRQRKRRWGNVTAAEPAAIPPPPPATNNSGSTAIDSKAKALALQTSIKARLEALKAKTGAAAPSLKRPPPDTSQMQQQAPSTKRAKHYDLDMSITGPTFRDKPDPKKPKANPYLAHTVQKEDESEEQQPQVFVDERLTTKLERKRHKELKFVEPGKFIEIAERKRLKASNAEQAGFMSGRKAGMTVTANNMANIYGTTEVLDDDDYRVAPRPEGNEKTVMPYVVEWWDLELLPGHLKKQVGVYEGKVISKAAQSQMQQLNSSSNKSADSSNLVNEEVNDLRTQCFNQAMLQCSKTATLIQHIVPIKPPNAKDGPEVEPTLYLTKKERKRQRKMRRAEKQREQQDLQAAGLVSAPEPRLTLQNFIKVLGDQAFVDPSQMEQKVVQQVQARQRAHIDRNEANKLTKEQRSAKLARKYMEDTSGGLHVALFYVKDMSHPYHRTKVDLNAQQLNITGGVVECQIPQVSCVIIEGGPKAIKRYTRLMLVRMKWKGSDNLEEEEDDEEEDEEGVKRHKFNPDNRCELVWTGMATKRFFKGFVFQACETSDQAGKVLRSKGVGHFWDQILTHASGRGDGFQLKLAESDDDEENDDNMYGPGVGTDDEEDVAVREDDVEMIET
jgi:U4/U6 small nuclear ribonucleoprotein PRP3